MLTLAARSSPLSRAQVAEFSTLFPLSFETIWVETIGDKDRTTSLRSLDKTDFFTREIDQMLLSGKARLAVHSAKDLPSPMPNMLCVAALTAGLDPRDALVMKEGITLETLPQNARIATSSVRREESVRLLRGDFQFQDLRGTISERLQLLEQNAVDGVIVAEAALIRLKLLHLNRIYLPGDTTENQGRLAIVCRTDDEEMISYFRNHPCAFCT